MNKKKLNIILSIVGAVIIFVGIYFAYNNLKNTVEVSNLKINENTDENEDLINNFMKADDILVQNENGENVKLSSFVGTPVVLNFWASWCMPCRMEMPHFNEAYKKNDDIKFMMVNATSEDGIDDAKSYIENSKYEFDVYYDVSGNAISTYNITGFPTTIFIDKDGNIVNMAVGSLSKEQLNYAINLLKG